ncbi:MAG: ribbon-helix-helix protein, CopG family [Nocardioidaceae bacterium]
MKTAISLPDDTFEEATRRASDLGMSRSEFFARAARRYLDELDAQSLKGEIDDAVAVIDGPDDAQSDAVAAGRHLLSNADPW